MINREAQRIAGKNANPLPAILHISGLGDKMPDPTIHHYVWAIIDKTRGVRELYTTEDLARARMSQMVALFPRQTFSVAKVAVKDLL